MKQFVSLLALLVGLAGQSQTTTNMEQKIGAIEIVKFRLKSGIGDEEGRTKLLQLNQCVEAFDGFIERKLSRTEEGEWLDIVYWTSKKAALAAAEQVAKDPKALQAFAVIDESTMSMNHYDLIEKFTK